MTFKRIIFWSHLITGVVAGIFIFLMSFTGVILTYEKQIASWVDNSFYSAPAGVATPLSVDELAAKAIEATNGNPQASLVIKNTESSPAIVRIGRQGQLLIDPYTGENLGEGAVTTRAFFHWVTDLHRWLAFEGDSRNTGRAINGAANLIFLFIIISGLYIWLPKIWKWPFFKMNLLFKRNLPNAKARDYNWHHVFGIWSLIPLFFVITTAVVISYPWANNLVYQVYGEEAPQRRGPPGGAGGQATNQAANPEGLISLQEVVDIAKAYDEDWKSISLNINAGATAQVTLDTGTGNEPTKTRTLQISRTDGQIISERGFSDNSPGWATRIYIRFLHTGEALGYWGQAIAGLASIAACFLVYTGFALAYRRLIQPLFRKRA